MAVVFILVLFSDSLLFVMDGDQVSSRYDPGAQSGNETNFVFSETDVRHSDADEVRRVVAGEFIISQSIKLLWIVC